MRWSSVDGCSSSEEEITTIIIKEKRTFNSLTTVWIQTFFYCMQHSTSIRACLLWWEPFSMHGNLSTVIEKELVVGGNLRRDAFNSAKCHGWRSTMEEGSIASSWSIVVHLWAELGLEMQKIFDRPSSFSSHEFILQHNETARLQNMCDDDGREMQQRKISNQQLTMKIRRYCPSGNSEERKVLWVLVAPSRLVLLEGNNKSIDRDVSGILWNVLCLSVCVSRAPYPDLKCRRHTRTKESRNSRQMSDNSSFPRSKIYARVFASMMG